MKLEINKEQSCKNHKYMEIKQPTSEQPMEQRRNQKENFKYLWQMKMGTQYTKTCRMQPRLWL